MKIEISITKAQVQSWSNSLSGSYTTSTSTPAFNKVGCIKAVRTLTNLGLKEAKDMVEAAMNGTPQTANIHASLTRKDIEDGIRSLRDYGCTVNDISTNHRSIILGTIRETAIFASSVDEYSLAARLNELLAEYSSNDR